MTSPDSPSLTGRLVRVLRDRALGLKALTFAIIGVFNAAVDFGMFAFGYFVLGLPIIAANLLSWIVAVTGSYVLNSTYTFAAESGRKLSLRTYLHFVVAQIAGLVANTATVLAVAYVVPLLFPKETLIDPVVAGKILAIGASFVVNFSLSHFVVFRKRNG